MDTGYQDQLVGVPPNVLISHRRIPNDQMGKQNGLEISLAMAHGKTLAWQSLSPCIDYGSIQLLYSPVPVWGQKRKKEEQTFPMPFLLLHHPFASLDTASLSLRTQGL